MEKRVALGEKQPCPGRPLKSPVEASLRSTGLGTAEYLKTNHSKVSRGQSFQQCIPHQAPWQSSKFQSYPVASVKPQVLLQRSLACAPRRLNQNSAADGAFGALMSAHCAPPAGSVQLCCVTTPATCADLNSLLLPCG